MSQDPECDGFYTSSNGVTIICPDIPVGSVGVVDSNTYTKRDFNSLQTLVMNDDVDLLERSCTSGIDNMDELFSEGLSSSSYTIKIGSWDVSSVESMVKMFYECDSYIEDIGAWDVSNVTNMFGMFRYAESFNIDIGNWDVSNVIDMSYMFNTSNFNQDISNWCVSQISSEPVEFSTNSPLTEENKPEWGTCPSN